MFLTCHISACALTSSLWVQPCALPLKRTVLQVQKQFNSLPQGDRPAMFQSLEACLHMASQRCTAAVSPLAVALAAAIVQWPEWDGSLEEIGTPSHCICPSMHTHHPFVISRLLRSSARIPLHTCISEIFNTSPACIAACLSCHVYSPSHKLPGWMPHSGCLAVVVRL